MNLASPSPMPEAVTHVGAAWGTIPDWVTAIGTSAAFLIAAIALLIEARSRRASQARRVFAIRTEQIQYRAGEEIYGWRDHAGNWTLGPVPGLKSHVSRDFQIPFFDAGKATVRTGIRIRNESDEIIGPVLVRLIGADVNRAEHALGAYVAEPHQDADAYLLCEWVNAPKDPEYDFEIAFRDSSGRWWTRRENLPIKSVGKKRAAEYEGVAHKLVDADN